MERHYSWAVAGLVLSTLPISTQIVLANSANPKVVEIARKTTVRIENPSNTIASGSGFIIDKRGNTYTVITANHVVPDPKIAYKIYTHDGKIHEATNVQNLDSAPNFYDIALVTFTSTANYDKVDLGDSDSAQEGEPIFVSGFPFASSQSRQEYQFNGGIVTSRVTSREKGYTMRYNASTAGGMSGGAVFNSQGQVIGIHGQGDIERDVSIESRVGSAPALKVGINAAIPIKLFAQVSKTAIKLQQTIRVANRPLTIDLLFTRGQTKLADGDYAGAVVDFSESIRQKPDNPEAYNARATAKFKLGDTAGALSDLDTAIRQRPIYAVAFSNRGAIKRELKDLAGALSDYDQALRINPRSSAIYNNRALVRYDQGNLTGAIGDFNQAIAIQSRNGDFFFNRAALKYRSDDFRGAVTDFNQAVRINPKDTEAISGRGIAKIELKRFEDAVSDFDLVIRAQPTFAEGFHNRGLAKAQLNNLAGSIIDFNQAITLKPDYADAYKNRGIAKAKQGDVRGAVDDLRRAIDLYQGKNEVALRETQRILEQLPQR